MSIDCNQLRTLVVRPTLEYLGLWSQSAEELLLGTAAQESHLGTYIKQLDAGPAVGIYQMEPATSSDIWFNYLKYKQDLQVKIRELISNGLKTSLSDHMIGNLYYATAMARVHYLRVPEKLPSAEDLPGLAKYWKKYYNTSLGRGTEKEFIDNYKRYVT